MANFDRSSITQAGLNLMGKAVGGATIKFTRLVMGDGILTRELNLEIQKLNVERQTLFNRLSEDTRKYLKEASDGGEPNRSASINPIDKKIVTDIEAIDTQIEEISKQQLETVSSQILDLTGVISPRQNVDIRSIERNGAQCKVEGYVETSSIKQGFFWRECGLYAMDPDLGEILYNYAYSTKPDYIAASDSGMMEEILVSMVALVGANANVDITIDDSMVFATKKAIVKIENGYVYDESDIPRLIQEGKTALKLKNDIVLTKPIRFDNITMRFDLNNFRIILADEYEDDYIFSIGYMEDINSHLGHNRLSKNIYNGYIDCNDKLVWVVKYYFSWDFKCNNLRIERCGNGFIGYWPEASQLDTYGCEMLLDNITCIHSLQHNNESIAFDIRTTDSHFNDCYAQYFRYGFINRGSNNYFDKCHCWGLPKNYSINQRMAIGFINEKSNASYYNCTADTPELINPELPASRENGGIGFYIYGVMLRLSGCFVITHIGSEDNTLIPYWVEDNVDGVTSMSNDVYLTNCFVPRNNNTKMKMPIYYNGSSPLTIIGCNFDHNGVSPHTCEISLSNTTLHVNDSIINSGRMKNNTCRVMCYDGIISIMRKTESGEVQYYNLYEKISDTYNLQGLKALRDKFDSICNKYNNNNIMGHITTTLYTFDAQNSRDCYDLVMWVGSKRNFIYVKDGYSEVTYN